MMETDPLVVQAEMKLLECAERLVIMADSRKLRQRSSMVVAPLSRITTVVTDSGAAPEELEMLRAAGIDTVVVTAEEPATEPVGKGFLHVA
jgi:DeoR family ulaG and ulaABCDEF operon transcriptional repressor